MKVHIFWVFADAWSLPFVSSSMSLPSLLAPEFSLCGCWVLLLIIPCPLHMLKTSELTQNLKRSCSLLLGSVYSRGAWVAQLVEHSTLVYCFGSGHELMVPSHDLRVPSQAPHWERSLLETLSPFPSPSTPLPAPSFSLK